MTGTEWRPAAKVQDLTPDTVLAVEIDGRDIAIYQMADGSFCATDNVCTHGYARLSDGFFEDGVIECPLHGGQFDVRTGKGMCPPIMEDLPVFEVKVVDDTIMLRMTGR